MDWGYSMTGFSTRRTLLSGLLASSAWNWVGRAQAAAADAGAVAEASGRLSTVYLWTGLAHAEWRRAKGLNPDLPLYRWRNFLRKQYRRNAREVASSQEIDALAPGVLVLPSVWVLTAAEQQAIDRFIGRGGSLLATGATGSMDEAGRTVGYGFLERRFSLRVIGPLDEHAEWFILPFGDGPLTWSLPAGRRLSLGPAAVGLTRVQADHVAAIFTNWARRKDDLEGNTAIAFGEQSGSRSAYFTFTEENWGYLRSADLNALLSGTLRWLQRQPSAYVAAWPNGKTAAQLIEMDTEFQFFSAPVLADGLERIGVRGTFYCLTSEAVKYPDIVKNLIQRGHEIAYHAEVHVGFKSLSLANQRSRLEQMRTQMQTILGDAVSQVTGFRAPTESYDDTTEVLMQSLGIRHHAADPNSTQDRLPFFSASTIAMGRDEGLIVLPRTQMDDINLKQTLYGPARVGDILVQDLNLVLQSGAMGLVSVHSQNFVPGGLMRGVLPPFLEQVARRLDQLWVARGDAIAAWWRDRARARLRVRSDAQRAALELELEVTGAVPIQGLTVFVTHPASGQRISLRGEGVGSPMDAHVLNLDPQRSAIVLGMVRPGLHVLALDFQDVVG